MAPRQDRTHPLVFGHSTANFRLTSTKEGYCYSYGGGGCGSLESGVNNFRGLNDFDTRNNLFFDLLSNVNFEPKKKNIHNLLNKRKVRFNLTHCVSAQERKHKGSLQERDEIRALEKEAIMYKLKRQEIQAQTRELRLELYKKNQEIRRKKREVKRLKAFEKELIKSLDKCDHQQDIKQPLSNNLQITAAAPSAFRANLYKIYVLCAALLSFLLVQVVSYGSIVVNRV